MTPHELALPPAPLPEPPAFPPLGERDEVCATAEYGLARIRLRVRGPLMGGAPAISWQGGWPMDHPAWFALRLCVELVAAARRLDDPRLIAALAAYPPVFAILQAAALAAHEHWAAHGLGHVAARIGPGGVVKPGAGRRARRV